MLFSRYANILNVIDVRGDGPPTLPNVRHHAFCGSVGVRFRKRKGDIRGQSDVSRLPGPQPQTGTEPDRRCWPNLREIEAVREDNGMIKADTVRRR